MKRHITLCAICVLASILMTPLAAAQCTAGTMNDPLLGTWGYHTEGISIFSTNPPPIFVYVSAGTFTASVDVNGNPVLAVTDTSNKNLVIYRLEQQSGKFQIFPDCSGGVILFTKGTINLEFDFWFVAGGSEIYFVSNQNGVIATGVAKKV